MLDSSTRDREIVLDRLIAAPQSAIWAAWTDPDRLPRWWGPRGFTCRTHEIDLREGGVWRFDMISPDGTVYPNRHRYRRIEPETLIAYTLDDDGKGEIEFEAEARFAPAGGDTQVTLTMTFASAAIRRAVTEAGAVRHGHTTLDCLTEDAMGDGTLSLTRILDASPERVWQAWTTEAELAKWCFPKDMEVEAASADIREGGAWFCRMEGHGEVHEARGTYTELVPNHRIAFTHGWRQEDGSTGPLSDLVVSIEPMEGGTRLTLVQVGLSSAASRDGHREGWSETLDNLLGHLGET